MNKLTDFFPIFNHSKKQILLFNSKLPLANTIKNSIDTQEYKRSNLYNFFSDFNEYFSDGYIFYIINHTEGHNLDRISDNNKKYSLKTVLKEFPVKILTGNLIEIENHIPCMTWFEPDIIKTLDKEIKFIFNFDKKFLFLNRIPKLHRVFLYEEMLKTGILEESFYSFNPEKITDYIGYNTNHEFKSVEENYEFNDKETEYFKNEKFNIDVFYKNSFCSIVSESEYENDILFFTEKIVKPILMYHPFIVFSSPFYLKTLKEFGFKTFDRWWDESYDIELDYKKRIEKIIKSVNPINSKSKEELIIIKKEMEDTLIHNKSMLFKFHKLYPQYFSHFDFTNNTNPII